MNGRFEGKFIRVTGGNSDIGFTAARQFVAEGATVFITGRRQEELDKAVGDIGRNVTGIRGDVSNAADLDRWFAQIQRKVVRLDVVVANAGSGTFCRSVCTRKNT